MPTVLLSPLLQIAWMLRTDMCRVLGAYLLLWQSTVMQPQGEGWLFSSWELGMGAR